MKKIIWILIGILIFLIAFFYPKDAGYVVGMIMPLEMENATAEVRYDCYGFFVEKHPDINCADCGIYYTCYGLLGDKHCYNMYGKEILC